MADDFRKLQYAFAAHLRDPAANPAPADIEDRRLAIYRGLFFNNLCSLLAGTFPVLRRTLGEERWRALVRLFFRRHPARTPLFLEVPREFATWLAESFEGGPGWPGFITELAHYEWVELALSVSEEEIRDDGIARGGDLLDGAPVLSPLAWPLAYRWPVHRIGPAFQPDAPGDLPTFLVVYRNRDDDVGFTAINAVTARLLELMKDNDAAGRELLARIAVEIRHPEPAQVIAGGAAILDELRRLDVILGARL